MVEIFLVSMVLLLTGFGFYRLMRAEREARRYLELLEEERASVNGAPQHAA